MPTPSSTRPLVSRRSAHRYAVRPRLRRGDLGQLTNGNSFQWLIAPPFGAPLASDKVPGARGKEIHSMKRGAIRHGLIIGMLCAMLSSSASAWHPLETPDTSSPRATIESVLALVEEAAQRYSESRRSPSPATHARLRQVARKAQALLDRGPVAERAPWRRPSATQRQEAISSDRAHAESLRR
jgi:hypothetical protein